MNPTSRAAPPGYVERLVVDTPENVASYLRAMVERGRLVSMTVPRPVAGGRVAVQARLIAPTSGTTAGPATVTPASAGRVATRHSALQPIRQAACEHPIAATAGVAGAVGLALGVGYATFLLISALWPLLLLLAVVLYLIRRRH
jgi:hypothetical protein